MALPKGARPRGWTWTWHGCWRSGTRIAGRINLIAVNMASKSTKWRFYNGSINELSGRFSSKPQLITRGYIRNWWSICNTWLCRIHSRFVLMVKSNYVSMTTPVKSFVSPPHIGDDAKCNGYSLSLLDQIERSLSSLDRLCLLVPSNFLCTKSSRTALPRRARAKIILGLWVLSYRWNWRL